ncbi:hypothetical protein GJ496_011197 [Pomphorhynchus laevis]|nr:hypothetical protein GJ496_011197 [Pomphorhynchus laevis]
MSCHTLNQENWEIFAMSAEFLFSFATPTCADATYLTGLEFGNLVHALATRVSPSAIFCFLGTCATVTFITYSLTTCFKVCILRITNDALSMMNGCVYQHPQQSLPNA